MTPIVQSQRRLRSRAALLAAAALLALGHASETLARCAQEQRLESLHVHEVKTRLMVAALACDARSEYNSFVSRFQPDLVQNGEAMKSFFRREYGAQSTERLNSFVTWLANKISQENSTNHGAFCAFSKELFDTVVSLGGDKIATALPDHRRAARLDDRTCLVQIR